MTERTLVIGDIHGCYDELQALLDLVGLTVDDTIIHIGDMIDRGPKPAEVVAFFRDTPNTRTLMGNREDKHIRTVDGMMDYNPTREITRLQFGDDDLYHDAVDFMRTLPIYIDLPDALLVHGYYEPGLPPHHQDRDVLLGHPEGEERLTDGGHDPWHVHYDYDKPVIFGHRDYPFLNYRNRAYAIDTRCVYGGRLTGLLLPDFIPYSVPARDDHWSTLQQRYAHILAG